MSTFWNSISWVLIFCSLLAAPSFSLIVQLADLQTMAKRSDIVAHGYVGDKRVKKDDLGRIITLTDIEVIDGLHGAKTGQIITFYQVGGEKDGLVMPLMGGHVYNVGQELIVFGLSLGDSFVSYGAGQGKLDITIERGQEIVREDLGDVHAVNKYSPRNVYKPTPLSFDNKEMLKDEIRLMIKER